MRTLIAILALSTVLIQPAEAQSRQPLKLMPIPSNLQPGSGELTIGSSFSVAITGHTETRLQTAVEIFLNDLRRQTGMLPLDTPLTDPSKTVLIIRAGQRRSCAIGGARRDGARHAGNRRHAQCSKHLGHYARIADLPAAG